MGPEKTLDARWKWDHEKEYQNKTAHTIGPSGEKQFTVKNLGFSVLVYVRFYSKLLQAIFVFSLKFRQIEILHCFVCHPVATLWE